METAQNQSHPGYWLRSMPYDLLFFHFSVFLGLMWLIPFGIFGPRAIFIIYLTQSMLSGVPHLYTTCASLMPDVTRKNMNMKVIGGVAAFALLGGLVIVLFRSQWISNAVISFTFFLGAWHSHKQHSGICKIYDYSMSKRFNDPALVNDLKPLYLFYMLTMNSIIVYSFTLDKIPYRLGAHWELQLIYPQLPREALWLYIFFTALVGVWAFYKSIYQRCIVAKKVFPLPQVLLLACTLTVLLSLYVIVPPEGYMLLWIIPTLGHNIQYMAFVWMFEKKRVEHVNVTEPENIKSNLALVRKGRYLLYFLPIYLATFFTVGIGLAGFAALSIGISHVLTIFHYVGDGFLWKKNLNSHVVPVTNLLINGLQPATVVSEIRLPNDGVNQAMNQAR
jgi:hypothetical protein